MKLKDIMTPNPRVVSRELLTRDAFVPATTLNMLAAAWIQFMTRDWFSHGTGDINNPWTIPLPSGVRLVGSSSTTAAPPGPRMTKTSREGSFRRIAPPPAGAPKPRSY